MSSLKVHTIQSIATSAALYPVMGSNVIPFGLAVIFIDVDHAVEYVRQAGSLDVRGVFAQCKLIEHNLDKNFLVLNAFHTVEFFALVLALGLISPVFYYVFAGMVYHMAFDAIHLIRLKQPFARAFSVVEYYIRSKNGSCITAVKDLFAHPDLDTRGVENADYWFLKWGINRTACYN